MDEWKDENNTEKGSDHKKKHTVFLSTIILVGAIMCIGYVVWGIQDNVNGKTKMNVAKYILEMEDRKGIFRYLKEMQGIEDTFYGIVSKNISRLTNTADISMGSAAFENSIKEISELMKETAKISPDLSMTENHNLFMDEMKTFRDVLLEKQFAFEHRDQTSAEKAKVYYEKYLLYTELRRTSLQKVFDEYGIAYIDLGNKIQYETK
ncbi:MAG: hypothetical protein ACOYVK_04845 [Bacillota bacterium]